MREATNAAKAFQGTPQQKAALLDDLLTQGEKSIDGFKVIVRERGTDGSYIYVGQFGEARVVHPTTGQIYGGKYDPARGGFQFGRDGSTTPNYDNLTLK